MIDLDRKIPPALKEIESVEFRHPVREVFSNGVNLFSFADENQQALKIDFYFKAGNRFHNKFRLPLIVNQMLAEGTENYSAKKLAGIFDYYGAVFNTTSNHDYAVVSLTMLPKYAGNLLPVLADILHSANFPEHELEVFLSKKQQELTINQQKVSFLARNFFPGLVMGYDFVYGHPVELADYQDITSKELREFFIKYYRDNAPVIIASGYFNKETKSLLEQYFGRNNKPANPSFHPLNISSPDEHKRFIVKEDVVQNAIRVGRQWVPRTHPDYAGLSVLITLFGGYFGSRLMRNIREDKGYTYGIGAGISMMHDASYFFISTEVKKENYGDTLTEIYKEMNLLRQKPVDDKELSLVKNYMIANFLRGFDGPFARADRFLEMVSAQLDFDFYKDYLKKIKQVSPAGLLRLAQLYLNQENYYELVVGNKP